MRLRRVGIVREQIQAIAESLHVDNLLFGPAGRGDKALSASPRFGVRSSRRFACSLERSSRRRAHLLQFAQIHQGHPMTRLRFVQIRRGHQDRQAIGRQVSEHVPEFAPRHRINAGRRFVQQKHVRLGHQRADQR